MMSAAMIPYNHSFSLIPISLPFSAVFVFSDWLTINFLKNILKYYFEAEKMSNVTHLFTIQVLAAGNLIAV